MVVCGGVGVGARCLVIGSGGSGGSSGPFIIFLKILIFEWNIGGFFFIDDEMIKKSG